MLGKMKKLVLPFSFLLLAGGTAAGQAADHVVISEVAGGGGNTTAPYNTDYIELYNPTANDIVMTNWSVQYAPNTGETWQVATFTGTIKAHSFFLISGFTGNGAAPLPFAADATSGLSIASLQGKVVLVNNSTAVTGANPTNASIIDKVGWGSAATGSEGFPAPTSNTASAVERKAFDYSTDVSMMPGGEDHTQGNGHDSDSNDNDFVIVAPNPQYSGSPKEQPTVTSIRDVLAKSGSLKSVELAAIYPNPMQANGTVKFGLPKTSSVDILVFTLGGAKVLEKRVGTLPAGYHETELLSGASKKLTAGTYIVRVVAGGSSATGKFVVTE